MRSLVLATSTGLLLCGLISSGVNADNVQVYRWKDANGKYHFSDQRPATVSAETLEIDTPTQKPNPELERYRQQTRTTIAALDAERAEAERKTRQRQVIAIRQERNCVRLRNAMRAEEHAAVVYNFDVRGDMQHLTDDQRNRYKNDLQTQWQRYCNQ